MYGGRELQYRKGTISKSCLVLVGPILFNFVINYQEQQAQWFLGIILVIASNSSCEGTDQSIQPWHILISDLGIFVK